MDFSLSPKSDVQINLSFKQAEVNLKHIERQLEKSAEKISECYRNTGEVVDYLALEHPSVRKTNQKHDQRRHHRRSAYYVGRKRAQKWLRLYKAELEFEAKHPGLNVVDVTSDGRLVGDGAQFISQTGQLYFGRKHTVKSQSKKDHPHYWVNTKQLPVGVSRNTRQVLLFENEQLSVRKPLGPVPEPPVGLKKPTRAEAARIIAERKDYLPRPRVTKKSA
jgi:hypothetical protein